MGEFKKGDEVRLIKSEDYSGNGRYGKTGEIGTVIQYDAIDHTYYVDFIESGQWWAKASNLEPSAATLKIEAGKFYKTRDGRKVGPVGLRARYGSDGPYRIYGLWNYLENGLVGTISNGDHKDDLIAEWIDEPVSKPSNDNAQPKFKVGDRVKCLRNYPGQFTAGKEYVVATDHFGREYESVKVKFDDAGSTENGWLPEFFELVAPTTTIVALIEDGQPKPSSTPHVHASTGAAEKEAKRLAAKYKGKQFGVFTLSATHEEAAPVYDHKWQNMAALGLKIDAIKELRAVAGLDLLSAKRAVEAFEQAA